MSKGFKWILGILVVAALACAAVLAVANAPGEMEGVYAMASAGEGSAWVAMPDGNDILFCLVRADGHIQKQFTRRRVSGGEVAHVTDMSVDGQGRLFYLKSYTDAETGRALAKQELAVYIPQTWPFGRHKSIRLDSVTDEAAVQFIEVYATSSVSLVGRVENANALQRRVLDIDALLDGKQVIKHSTAHRIVGGEDVYKAVALESSVVYISKAGLVYAAPAGEDEPTLLYPVGTGRASYASFITEETASSVVIGEQTGGGVLRLYPADGRAEYLLERGQGFSAAPYSGRETLDMSYAPGDNESFAVLAQNPDTLKYELVVSYKGSMSYVSRLAQGFWQYCGQIIGVFALVFIAGLLAVLVVYGVGRAAVASRTILVKLVFSSVPLLVLALVLFGTYSYFSYQSALTSTYETKVQDQGDLMRALFTTGTTFDSITSPGKYNSTEYTYLRNQMETRDVYTSSAYYADSRVYTGVDTRLPALYPYGVVGSGDLYAMCRDAALTGRQQSAVIDDTLGRRIVCITPVGSSSGDTVFLLETSIFEAQIQQEISRFLLNYLLIAAVCIVAAVVLLMIAFTRIVRPIQVLTGGLERFTMGDREVRIPAESNDELGNMGRLFNRMAEVIKQQMLKLQTESETYYRFVPQRILLLLGEQNLTDVRLGTQVGGRRCILSVSLYPHTGQAADLMVMTNRFFADVHQVANAHDATVLGDSVDLKDLKIICPSADAAVAVAMEALALVDSDNARSGISQLLDVSFLLHAAEMVFAICGDDERYIPAMLSAELERVTAQCEDYRRISSRLLVTEAAWRLAGQDAHKSRYIGTAPDDDPTGVGLYDFYGSGSNESIRKIDATLGAFNKAMQLYHQQRWYDAKNLFAAVLRENQSDNVARHYIFLCEKKL